MKVFWAVPENGALVTQARNEGVPLLRLVVAGADQCQFRGLRRAVSGTTWRE